MNYVFLPHAQWFAKMVVASCQSIDDSPLNLLLLVAVNMTLLAFRHKPNSLNNAPK